MMVIGDQNRSILVTIWRKLFVVDSTYLILLGQKLKQICGAFNLAHGIEGRDTGACTYLNTFLVH